MRDLNELYGIIAFTGSQSQFVECKRALESLRMQGEWESLWIDTLWHCLPYEKADSQTQAKEDPRITWDREKDMGLNFDLTVVRGKVAFTVGLNFAKQQSWTQKSTKPFTPKKKKINK